MQNVQNAAEIQQRVINLVELYRNKVGKNDLLINEAKNWYEESIGSLPIDFDTPEDLVKRLRVNEQLLGHFYSVVAGDSAEESVLSEFLADYYDNSIFSSEEEDFLCSHFENLVNFIIQTPFDNLELIGERDIRDFHLIPMKVLDLMKSRVHIPTGSVIYNPFAGLTQMTSIFPDCKFYCEETYSSYNKKWNAFSEKCHKESNILLGKRNVNLMTAWMKVALYANSVDATIIDDGKIPEKYDSVISFIPQMPRAIPEQEWELDFDLPDDPEIVNKIMGSYNNLPNGGKMVLILPNKNLWASNKFYSLRPLWEKMISDKSLAEIIQLPKVAIDCEHEAYSIVIAEKGLCASTTTMMDVRFAVKETKEMKFFDLNLIEEMLSNGGKAGVTGLRKLVHIPVEQLDPDCLIPRTYVVERPLKEELPVPLSELCTLENTLVREVKEDLPEDTPWVESRDLNVSFRGNLDLSYVKKADCPNNPVFVEGSKDYNFYESGNFIDDFFGQVDSKKGVRVYEYRRCTYLDGTKDAVLFVLSKQGLKMAIVHALGKPIAIEEGILTVCPKKGVDVMTLAASLSLPIVLRQLKAYKNYSLANHLDDILVPTDRRIIYDEIQHLLREQKINKDYEDKFNTQKAEYINEVRMRRHDIRPHLRQLASLEKLMLHYIDNVIDMEELKRILRDKIEHSHVALTSISTIVDHLSDEEIFGIPELLNIDSLLSDIEVNHDEGEGFVIEYGCDEETFKNSGYVIPNLFEQWQLAEKQGLNMVKFIKDKSKENLPLFVSIAPVDFQRMVDNIIENARKHGFTDHTRTDYYIDIDLSCSSEREMYQIDFSNNGNPLPVGMTKERYGLKGEKAGQTGGTGSGGHIVKSIISHYGGDYDVFCKDGITTIRILLPIKAI